MHRDDSPAVSEHESLVSKHNDIVIAVRYRTLPAAESQLQLYKILHCTHTYRNADIKKTQNIMQNNQFSRLMLTPLIYTVHIDILSRILSVFLKSHFFKFARGYMVQTVSCRKLNERRRRKRHNRTQRFRETPYSSPTSSQFPQSPSILLNAGLSAKPSQWCNEIVLKSGLSIKNIAYIILLNIAPSMSTNRHLCSSSLCGVERKTLRKGKTCRFCIARRI